MTGSLTVVLRKGGGGGGGGGGEWVFGSWLRELCARVLVASVHGRCEGF